MTQAEAITLPSAYCPASTADVDECIESDLQAAREVLRERFSDHLSALVLGGSFGRGEGTVIRVRTGGPGMPLLKSDTAFAPLGALSLFIVARAPLPRAELASARRTILARARAREVELEAVLERDLARLPPTLRTFDLREGHRVFAGDREALRLLPRHTPDRIPRREAEELLRKRLGALLLGYPQGKSEGHELYQTGRAIIAAVDALLVLHGRYAVRAEEKAKRLAEMGAGEELRDLVDAAIAAKLRLERPRGFSLARFWDAAVSLFLDSLLAVFGPAGNTRAEKLHALLRGFAVRSTDPWRSARRRVLALLAPDRRGAVEELALGLLICREPCAGSPDLAPLARRAAIALDTDGEGHSWSQLRERAAAELDPRAGAA